MTIYPESIYTWNCERIIFFFIKTVCEHKKKENRKCVLVTSVLFSKDFHFADFFFSYAMKIIFYLFIFNIHCVPLLWVKRSIALCFQRCEIFFMRECRRNLTGKISVIIIKKKRVQRNGKS